MRPALAVLDDGQLHRPRDVVEALADQLGLSEGERAQRLPSGRQRLINNRVEWALTYLVHAGLVVRPVRGQLLITDEGREALTENPERIDVHVLERYPAYLAFRDRTT